MSRWKTSQLRQRRKEENWEFRQDNQEKNLLTQRQTGKKSQKKNKNQISI